MTTPVTALRPPAWDLATPDLGVQTRFDITHVTYAAFDLVTAFGFYTRPCRRYGRRRDLDGLRRWRTRP